MKKAFKKILILAIICCCFLVEFNPKTANAQTVESQSLSQLSQINNLVAFVDFDNEEFVDAQFLSNLDKAYNTDEISLKNFFLAESLNSLTVNTIFLNDSGSIKMEHGESYYAPKYEYDGVLNVYNQVNPNGYDNRYFINGEPVNPESAGALEHIERIVREQLMLREISQKLNGLIADKKADNNGDGKIDALTVIVDNKSFEYSNWDSILWPHMSYAYVLDKNVSTRGYYVPAGFLESYGDLSKQVTIDGLNLSNYNLLTTSYINVENSQISGNVGVLCHEFLHNLGLYDYYYYPDQTYEPVGDLDILGITHQIPQFNLSYLRQKLGWLEEGENILPIEESGSYTLNAVTATDSPVKAYKLVPNNFSQTGEYFMMEMRTNTGGFDSQLKSSGLVVYRINEKNGYINAVGNLSTIPYGNMYGGRDREEIFVYRMGGADSTNKSNASLAILDGEEVVNGYYYEKNWIGSTDLSKEPHFFVKSTGVLMFKRNYYGNTLSYSSGANSGIAITNITLSADNQSVSFNVEFDDSSVAVSQTDDASVVQTDYGALNVVWQSGSRKGKTYILQVEYDGSLVGIEGDKVYCKKLPQASEMINGKITGYNTVKHQVLPISNKKGSLNEGEGVATFVMLDDGETQRIIFAGATLKSSSNQITLPTDFLKDFLNSNQFKLVIYGAIGIVALSFILALFTGKKRKK